MENNYPLGYLLNNAARLTKWDLNNKLVEYGMTAPQWSLLRDIYMGERLFVDEEERFHKLTPAAIAERLHADRPTVSCMIERLVKQGWIYRVSNPRDRRSQIILLTDKSKEAMPRLEAMGFETMDKAVIGFTEEEVQQLKEYLSRIMENLKEEER